MTTFSEKGLSALAAVAVMVLLSVLGLAIASVVSNSKEIYRDQYFYDRTSYVTQAGIEYAMRKIYEGVTPVVNPPGINFGGGNFTIGRAGRQVTVTGTYSSSQTVHSVTSPSQADCTEFDLTHAGIDDDKLSHLQFQKICLEQTVLDKINISWSNPGTEGLRKVRVESSTLYDNPPVLSGQVTELANYIMNGNNNNNFNEIGFTNDMEGKTFTISFIMGDGSAKSYTFTPDDD